MKWTKLSAIDCGQIDLTPYHVLVCLLDPGEPEVAQSAEIVCRELAARGLRALFDERELAPEAKLKEATRLGLPTQINVSSHGLERGAVELVTHSAKGPRSVPLEDVAEITSEVLSELKRL